LDGALSEPARERQMKHLIQIIFVVVFAAGCSADDSETSLSSAIDNAWQSSAPVSIEHLTNRDYKSSLRVSRKLGDYDGYHSYAVQFDSDGLALTAVMNVPDSALPDRGFPILIMNHGNVGNNWAALRDYYSSDQDSDAYRELSHTSLITRYAKEGFVVFFPDYRGHGHSETNGQIDGHWQLNRNGDRAVNAQGEHIPRVLDNDGLRFGGWLYTAYYTIDVLNLIAAVSAFEEAPEGLRLDLENLFVWGRSLGGDVTARALTVSDKIKAASLWVPATTALWDQAHHYQYDSPCCADGISMENLFVELQTYNAVHGTDLVTRDLNPSHYIDQVESPVLIQVSIDDAGVRSAWGIQYHYELQEYGVPTELRIYPGDAHVFTGDVLEQAIQADLRFFRALMR
jgi:dienelactone hydrolase